jgi:MFS transporter, Spinster family, sphingosine-1-phosphate transporter
MNDRAESAPSARWSASQGFLLLVLTAVGTVNWADRQVVPILFPGIRKDLNLSDTELGVIGGLAFSLIYALSSFAFGYAADRHVRKYVMAFGLVLWSMATAASGLADGFWSLFWARFFTGIGEASLYPCALSLIAERFPPTRRGRALGIFAAAAAIGGGLGIGLGGRLAETLGWQKVFFIYGGVGLLCLPALLLLHEPKRESLAHRETTAQALKAVVRDKRLLWLWAAGTMAMASGHGFGAWVPSYFVRNLGLDVTQAGALFGASALIGGILGGILGGTLADRRRRARVGGEFDVAATAAVSAAVLVLLTLQAGVGTVAAIGGLFATLMIYGIFPGLLSAMLSLAPAHRHGATGAVNTLCLGGIGAASGPFVVGAASDALGSLHTALYLPIIGLFAASLLAVQAGRVVRRTDGEPLASTP